MPACGLTILTPHAEMEPVADKQTEKGLESSTDKPVVEDASPAVDILGDQNVDPVLKAKLHLINNVGHFHNLRQACTNVAILIGH